MNRGNLVYRVIDLLLLPLVALSGWILWGIRRFGLQRAPLCRAILVRIGVLPVRRHYYEPFLSADDLRRPLSEPRELPGIDWNVEAQLQLLTELKYAPELADLATPSAAPLAFRISNGSFESGDAEFLYQLIRARKPRRVFEIGSGNSTLMARRAIERNRAERADYTCKHLCIEPFEAPWLETAGVIVVRRKVEDVERSLFQELEAGDLLFIDSSHMIRPQGDVLVEYLQILPTLKRGVIVHVHDIFTPGDYPAEWLLDKMLLWNEQYLLEAFLTENRGWRIIGALSLLARQHFSRLQEVCPYLTPDRQPGSFYMEKV